MTRTIQSKLLPLLVMCVVVSARAQVNTSISEKMTEHFQEALKSINDESGNDYKGHKIRYCPANVKARGFGDYQVAPTCNSDVSQKQMQYIEVQAEDGKWVKIGMFFPMKKTEEGMAPRGAVQVKSVMNQILDEYIQFLSSEKDFDKTSHESKTYIEKMLKVFSIGASPIVLSNGKKTAAYFFLRRPKSQAGTPGLGFEGQAKGLNIFVSFNPFEQRNKTLSVESSTDDEIFFVIKSGPTSGSLLDKISGNQYHGIKISNRDEGTYTVTAGRLYKNFGRYSFDSGLSGSFVIEKSGKPYWYKHNLKYFRFVNGIDLGVDHQ